MFNLRLNTPHSPQQTHLVSYKTNPNAKRMISGMLEEAMTNALARTYNISGKGGKGKERFQDLGLYRLLFGE